MPRRQFDHEKLEVYKFELRFIEWTTDLLVEIGEQSQPRLREVCDQLDRASLSSLLNTAEGNGRRGMKQRAKFFDDARGAATESAACLDALVAKRACGKERVEDGKEILLSVVSMLTKLVEKFEGGAKREEEGGGRGGVGGAAGQRRSVGREEEGGGRGGVGGERGRAERRRW